MKNVQTAYVPLSQVNMPLNVDNFTKSLIRQLSGLLEEMVGLDEASGFISIVGQNIGNEINQQYRAALDVSALDRDQVEQALIDLKSRILGDFYVIEADATKIVMGNRHCPFDDYVKGRPSLCMMTSNVFGTIAAENLGYAKVDIEETIAQGHDGCRVVVYLNSGADADAADGREYFQTLS